jgi:hypothetical protein
MPAWTFLCLKSHLVLSRCICRTLKPPIPQQGNLPSDQIPSPTKIAGAADKITVEASLADLPKHLLSRTSNGRSDERQVNPAIPNLIIDPDDISERMLVSRGMEKFEVRGSCLFDFYL